MLGVESLRAGGNTPLYVNPTARGAVLNATAVNKLGQTALHVLCNNRSQQDMEDDLLTTAAWLVSMGCPLDVKWAGKTANVVATDNGHGALGAYLYKVLVSGHTQGPEPGLLGRPELFKGYTYVSLTFLSHKLEEAGSSSGPLFTATSILPVEVNKGVGSNRIALEASQRVTDARHHSPDGKTLWWGNEVFLQTPLENMDDSALIFIRLGDTSNGADKIAEVTIPLQKKTIDSGRILLDCVAAGKRTPHSSLLVELALQAL